MQLAGVRTHAQQEQSELARKAERLAARLQRAQQDAAAAKSDLEAQLEAATSERHRLQQRSVELEGEVRCGTEAGKASGCSTSSPSSWGSSLHVPAAGLTSAARVWCGSGSTPALASAWHRSHPPRPAPALARNHLKPQAPASSLPPAPCPLQLSAVRQSAQQAQAELAAQVSSLTDRLRAAQSDGTSVKLE